MKVELTARDYESKKLLKRSSIIELDSMIDDLDGLLLDDAKNKIIELLDNNHNPKWVKQVVKYQFGDDYKCGGYEIVNYRYETEEEYNNRCDTMDFNIKDQIRRREQHEQEQIDRVYKAVNSLPMKSRMELIKTINANCKIPVESGHTSTV
jgi:hypothetical protein